MNKHQAIALLVVLATGCSAPRSFVAETGIEEASQQPEPLSRIQSVVQLQVDAASVYGQMIEYFLNERETDDTSKVSSIVQTVSHRLDAVLSFRPGSTELLPSYRGNRTELTRITGELKAFAAGTGGEWQTIGITGYASPDGDSSGNEKLAVSRALRFSNYLSRQLAIPQEKITIDACLEDWDGLQRLVAESKKPYAAEVIKALNATADPDARRKALKAIDRGKVWKDMEQTLFSKLRRMELEGVFYSKTTVGVVRDEAKEAGLSRLLALFNSRPEVLTLDELLTIAPAYRPGTEQFREVYEQAAYRFPGCVEAQLNAGAAALAAGDGEAAKFFLNRIKGNPLTFINLGILSLMEGDRDEAVAWFRKALPFRPRQARRSLEIMSQI